MWREGECVSVCVDACACLSFYLFLCLSPSSHGLCMFHLSSVPHVLTATTPLEFYQFCIFVSVDEKISHYLTNSSYKQRGKNISHQLTPSATSVEILSMPLSSITQKMSVTSSVRYCSPLSMEPPPFPGALVLYHC